MSIISYQTNSKMNILQITQTVFFVGLETAASKCHLLRLLGLSRDVVMRKMPFYNDIDNQQFSTYCSFNVCSIATRFR